MADITSQHLNLYTGDLASVEIVDGEVNNLFDDIDDIQFVDGGTRIKDIWFGVGSPNNEPLFVPRVFLLEPPGDSDQIVTLSVSDEVPLPPDVTELSDVPLAPVVGSANYVFTTIGELEEYDPPGTETDPYYRQKLTYDEVVEGPYHADPAIMLESVEGDQVVFAIQGQTNWLSAGDLVKMFDSVIEVVSVQSGAFTQLDEPPLVAATLVQTTTDGQGDEGPGPPFWDWYRWGDTNVTGPDPTYQLVTRPVDVTDIDTTLPKSISWCRVTAKVRHEQSPGDFIAGVLGAGRVQEGFAKYVSAQFYTETQKVNSVYYGVTPVTSAPLNTDTTIAVAATDMAVDEAPTMAPIFRVDDLVLLHHTATDAVPNPYTPDAVISLSRANLGYAALIDDNGVKVATSLYDIDLVAGELVIPSGSDLSAYTAPFAVEHRIEQYNRVTGITGLNIDILRPLTRDFPADSKLSSVYLPDLEKTQATAQVLYDTNTWGGNWFPDPLPTEATGEVNDEQHPIQVRNQDAIPEDWRFHFTNATSFDCYGRNVGLIGSGSTGTDFSPINPDTGGAYMTVKAEMWGGGWSSGNNVRVRTDPGKLPVEVRRVVLHGIPPDTESARIAVAGSINVE